MYKLSLSADSEDDLVRCPRAVTFKMQGSAAHELSRPGAADAIR
jgi:hypothetical protein